jgi:MFS family permease
MPGHRSGRTFYGWWIVAATFLNLFFAVGIIFYGFPVFYTAFVAHLGFTRAQVTQGFLIGFLAVGLPFGLLAGVLIDRIGARWIILSGVGFVGLSLMAMGVMTQFWQYEILCVLETMGYVLAGPIANQVLISRWFSARRGRAMGFAYLGVGLGGAVSPPTMTWLLHNFGWRHAIETVGATVMIVLFPVGIWITRSLPADLNLHPDGVDAPALPDQPAAKSSAMRDIGLAMRHMNFWLLIIGAFLVIGSINAVIQHFIFFLEGQGYSPAASSRFLSVLLLSSLAGRVIVGYIADRFRKKNTMAGFYLVISASIPILYLAHHPMAACSFAIIFGFAMGADYMLIPLVAAETFGVASLGKVLALIIMAYSIGQWVGPWIAGHMFDVYHNYHLAWKIMTCAGVTGSAAIYAISTKKATNSMPQVEDSYAGD